MLLCVFLANAISNNAMTANPKMTFKLPSTGSRGTLNNASMKPDATIGMYKTLVIIIKIVASLSLRINDNKTVTININHEIK